MPIIRSSLLALPMLLLVHAAIAADAGRVLLARGEAAAVRDGRVIQLALGMNVREGDLLRTGAGSSLQVRFADEAILSLRENSELRIDEFRYSGREDGTERKFLSLIKGGLRTITGVVGKTNHQNYRLSTVTAVIGIRGTDYSATLCQGDCRAANGALAGDGLYGRTHGASSGTNAIVVSNSVGNRTIGINENFFVADNKSAIQQLLIPPSFITSRPLPPRPKDKDDTRSAKAGNDKAGTAVTTGSQATSGGDKPADAQRENPKSAEKSGAPGRPDTVATVVNQTVQPPENQAKAGTTSAAGADALAAGNTPLANVSTSDLSVTTAGVAGIAGVTGTAGSGITQGGSSGFIADSRWNTPNPAAPSLQLAGSFLVSENLGVTGSSTLISSNPTIAGLGAYSASGSTENDQGGAFFTLDRISTNPPNAAATLTLSQQLTGFSASGFFDASSMPNLGAVLSGSAGGQVIDETISNPINANWGRWLGGSISSSTLGTTIISASNQFHYLYGGLTPPETVAAKTGTIFMVDFYGTSPTNHNGQTGVFMISGPLSVNFTTRVVSIPQISLDFSSSSQHFSFQTVNTPIQIRAGQGAFVDAVTNGTYTQGNNSAVAASLGITGIFMGSGGNHLGASFHARTAAGTTPASAQAVRLFTCSYGC